ISPSPRGSSSSRICPARRRRGRVSWTRSWRRPPIRLSKILAQGGLSSARGAEALLAAGRVTVNGQVRTEPGAQADPARDTITLDGRRLEAAGPRTYLHLNKPAGAGRR